MDEFITTDFEFLGFSDKKEQAGSFVYRPPNYSGPIGIDAKVINETIKTS